MFSDKNRSKRFQNEAKAIERKARRNGGIVTGRDAARLSQVKGRAVKFASLTTESEEDYK